MAQRYFPLSVMPWVGVVAGALGIVLGIATGSGFQVVLGAVVLIICGGGLIYLPMGGKRLGRGSVDRPDD